MTEVPTPISVERDARYSFVIILRRDYRPGVAEEQA